MRVSARSPLWRRALRSVALKMFHFAENNGDSCPTRNGETWLIRQLIASRNASKRSKPLVVFDVGANVGNYTRMALREAHLANCAIDVYAFEPSPHNAAILQQTFAANSNVRIVCVAVADRPGQAILYSQTSGSSQASLLKRNSLQVDVMEEITVPIL